MEREISTEAAFAIVSEPKIGECAGTKQPLHSVQTKALDITTPGTQTYGRRHLSCCCYTFQDNEWKKLPEGFQVANEQKQTSFIEHLPADIEVQKTFLIFQLLKEIDTMTSHSQIRFCHKNVTCVAIRKYHVRVGSIHAWKADGSMFKFWLNHLKTKE